MARRPSRTRKGRVISVDFSNVEDQKVVDEGEYECQVVSVEEKEGDKAPYLSWKFEITEKGKFEGTVVYNNTSLSDQSLWNLRNLMECMGFDVPKKAMDIDLDEFADAKIGLIIVNDDSYDGKPRNKVSGYFDLEEEEAPAKEKEEKAPARATRRARDGDGKTEEPARATRRGKKEKALEQLDQAEVADMNESELEDVVEKYKLDIDLDEHKTLRRKANAVIDALEQADQLAA